MKTFEVSLRCVGDVQDFVALTYAQPFDITVSDGYRSVDGKSFMQMFCLDLSLPQQVGMDCTEEQFRGFYDAAERFRI